MDGAVSVLARLGGRFVARIRKGAESASANALSLMCPV
jgi:hypothetical protein